MSRRVDITVKLIGGLGNQLFQIAAALYLSKSRQYVIRMQIAGNLTVTARNEIAYGLSKSSLRMDDQYTEHVTNIISAVLLRLNYLPNVFYKVIQAFINILQSIRKLLGLSRYSSVQVMHDLGYSEIRELENASLLIGYFQTYKYVEIDDVFSEIEKMFKPGHSLIVEEFRELSMVNNPLIIHMRLGDYIEEDKFGILDGNYYLDAIESMFADSHFGEIWVFSDDSEMCKRQIGTMLKKLSSIYGFDIRWISEKELNDWETWQVMRFGSGYIIANSSFSWWAAMMRLKRECKVISPIPWFFKMREPTNLIPKTWIRIPAQFTKVQIK